MHECKTGVALGGSTFGASYYRIRVVPPKSLGVLWTLPCGKGHLLLPGAFLFPSFLLVGGRNLSISLRGALGETMEEIVSNFAYRFD